MKNMSRVEIEKFTKKYFPEYIGDIHKVSYFDYGNIREYLINGWKIFETHLKHSFCKKR